MTHFLMPSCPAAALQDLSSHVLYRLSRARLMAGILSFTVDDNNNAKYKAALREEVELFQQEYRTLLYGGKMMLQVGMWGLPCLSLHPR
jgi:hypothetical protein